MTKSELRKQYLEKRRALSAEEHADLSAEIAELFFAEIDLKGIDSIHCFISMGHVGEVETGLVFERLWRDFPKIATFAPRVNEETSEIDVLPFTNETKVAASKWKIGEPAEGEAANPETIDLVIVPLLCFDLHGYRVGYGKGFYDRFLKQCREDCIKVGLSFFPPVEAIDDVHEGDVPLDLVITPKGSVEITN